VDLLTGEMYGWARACSVFQSGCSGALKPLSKTGRWDGWIKLNGTAQDSRPYGPFLVSGTPSEFEGWAWGGDPNDEEEEAVIGFVSFNSETGGGSNKYAVYTNLSINNAPTVAADPTTTGDYCFAGSPPIFLNWTFSDLDGGDTQSAYQIQIDDSGLGFPSPEIDTGKVLNSSNTYSPNGLSFGTSYWWRIRVWDSRDLQSAAWVTGSFTTDPRWPIPNFTWVPLGPFVGQDVTFTNSTTNCPPPCIYNWTFENGDPSAFSGETPPVVKFSASGDVTLDATSGGRSCPQKIQNIGTTTLPLPTWKEIAPF